MDSNRIQVVINPSECGFFIELGGVQATLTAIRQTADKAAHVVFSVSTGEEETAVIEYTPQQFVALVQKASPFWDWLGITPQ